MGGNGVGDERPTSRPAWSAAARRASTAVAAATAAEHEQLHVSAPRAELNSEVEVFQVTDVATAQEVTRTLLAMPAETYHACDTEVAHLDLNKSPIGQGTVICVSVYSGPDVDYGRGKGQALWIDTTDAEVLQAMKPFLEAPQCAKVWHNYGFDRHVLWNHQIDVRGFGGDTMHMARLWDASRTAGYSLEVLTEELVGRRKAPMKELFGVPVLRKDGSPGRKIELPPVEQLQNSPMTRSEWIGYSVYDSQGTWLLHSALRERLEDVEWQGGLTLFDFYNKYWRPFGELLTDLEREGIKVDAESKLPAAEKRALAKREMCELKFRRWATSYSPNAWFMNPGSGTQVSTLLFGGALNPRTREHTPKSRTFSLAREEYEEMLAARDGGEVDGAALAHTTSGVAAPESEYHCGG